MNFIKVPFADSGDKTTIPETDAGGSVNMTQGYTQAYSLDPATDPSAKRIEREKMNGLFNVITAALNEIQTRGVATFISSDDNGGSPFSYGKGSVVILDGVVYQSLVDSNTDTPPSSKWAMLLNSDSESSMPVGSPIPWPLATPPAGWLKCNGATFSASQYPKLALAYPALKLPDLRGEFLRGWDDGRGVDSGCSILSTQSAYAGSFTWAATIYAVQGTAGAVNITDAININGVSNDNSNVPTTTITLSPGDNRPRNIAFNYIVRAA